LPDQLFFDIVKMVVALACIVGLIYGVVFIMKRLLPNATRAGGSRIDLQMLSQLSVGSRQRVCVLRVQDRTLVLGVTEGSITTLAELSPQRSEAPKEADDPKIFADLLAWRKDAPAQRSDASDAQPERTPAPAPRQDGDDRGDGPQLFAPSDRPAR